MEFDLQFDWSPFLLLTDKSICCSLIRFVISRFFPTDIVIVTIFVFFSCSFETVLES